LNNVLIFSDMAESNAAKKLDELFKVYTAHIFNKKSFTHLRDLCLQSKAGNLQVRSFCWKVFNCFNILALLGDNPRN